MPEEAVIFTQPIEGRGITLTVDEEKVVGAPLLTQPPSEAGAMMEEAVADGSVSSLARESFLFFFFARDNGSASKIYTKSMPSSCKIGKIGTFCRILYHFVPLCTIVYLFVQIIPTQNGL